jgi:ribose-phosphate pyrophosphokinase
MEKIIFALPGNEALADKISSKLEAESGEFIISRFPDGETYIRVISNVLEKEVVLVCTLHLPNNKLLPLYFLAQNLRDMGAKKITVVAPYLAYMRQDKKFNSGEAITGEYFAELISSFADQLITVDPHLHRTRSLSEIYSIPSKVLHASQLISAYIKQKIKNPLLIGPDSESEQWVSEVAQYNEAPFIILQKERLSSKEVKITFPQLSNYTDKTPVLVDDIISTARTMIEAVKHLHLSKMKPAVCIGVHAVFADNAFEDLKKEGPAEIVTCNTILHETNKIDISSMIISTLQITQNEEVHKTI